MLKLTNIYNQVIKEESETSSNKEIFNTKTTGMGFYDSILNEGGGIGYHYWEKGVIGEIKYISPDEYLKRVRSGFKTNKDEGIYKESIDSIKKAISEGKRTVTDFLHKYK